MNSFIGRRNTEEMMPVRPGYSAEETWKAYNKIMAVDGGRAGCRLSTVEQLLSHYSEALTPIQSHPDNAATDEHNKDNINDMDSVDWLEILISCHHMHGYRLDGKPLGIHTMPLDFYG